MIIKEIPFDKWHLIKDDYEQNFGNKMPTDALESKFLGVFEDENLIGYVQLEQILHLNCVRIIKTNRQKEFFRFIINTIEGSISKGWSIITLLPKKFSALPRKYKMRNLSKDVEIWRKDF